MNLFIDPGYVKGVYFAPWPIEIAMNAVDVVFAGGILVWSVIPLMLAAGFLTPLPYNYYRLKKYDESCH